MGRKEKVVGHIESKGGRCNTADRGTVPEKEFPGSEECKDQERACKQVMDHQTWYQILYVESLYIFVIYFSI